MTPEQLKKWREKTLKLSQSQLAEKLSVSANTVARWERGDMKFPPYLELALETVKRSLKPSQKS